MSDNDDQLAYTSPQSSPSKSRASTLTSDAMPLDNSPPSPSPHAPLLTYSQDYPILIPEPSQSSPDWLEEWLTALTTTTPSANASSELTPSSNNDSTMSPALSLPMKAWANKMAHLWDMNPMMDASLAPSQLPMASPSLSSGSAAALMDKSTSSPASPKRMGSAPTSWSSLRPLTRTPALQRIPSPSGSTKSSLATTQPTTLSTPKYLAYLRGSTLPKSSASDSWMTTIEKSATSSPSWAQNSSWSRIASLCAATA
jgi:hypothetical protein